MSITCVSLKALCNAGFETALTPECEGWAGFPIPAKKLDGFPSGAGVFGRVPFKVLAAKGGSMVLLRPDDMAERRIKVEATFRAFYLLHTMERGDQGRTPAAYTLHYADGSTAERIITVGDDVADWLFPKEAANCRIGWTGYLRSNEFQKCVYVAEIVNPQPKKKVAAVSLKRRDPYGSYVLLGLTLSTAALFFKQAQRGSRVGLGDYLELAPMESGQAGGDILTLQAGALELTAGLYDSRGRDIGGAQVSAAIGGRRYAMKKGADGYTLSLPKQKGWRKYANAVTLVARRGGKTIARREAVLYAAGQPRSLTPPHGHRPPQFIIVAFDDCKNLSGVEAMLEVIENLKAQGARAPLTMYTAPCEPRSADAEKVKLLYQRMYELGCEFCNHTLNHNPGGINWFALSHKEQEREISGCKQWLRDNIPGLWEVYSQKSGGGGAAGFSDPQFSVDLMRRQKFEYNANNVTAHYDTNIPHPDVQFWPYKLADEWAINVGAIDGNAPPVHTPVTKGFYTDYSGKFDMPVADGVAMLMANLDYRYRSTHRPPLIINAMHEWGLFGYNPSHRHQKAILEGFLTEALVNQRKKYPNTHVITFHQLIEYMRRDDLAAIIAEGSGQGRK